MMSVRYEDGYSIGSGGGLVHVGRSYHYDVMVINTSWRIECDERRRTTAVSVVKGEAVNDVYYMLFQDVP